MNIVLLTGTITSDIWEAKDKGYPLVHFQLRVPSYEWNYTKKAEINHIDIPIVAFGKYARFVKENFKQGMQVLIHGRYTKARQVAITQIDTEQLYDLNLKLNQFGDNDYD